MSGQNLYAVLEWPTDNHQVSIHHLKHIITPKKPWNDYKPGDSGLCSYPSQGDWEYIIHAVGASRKELEPYLKTTREKVKKDKDEEADKNPTSSHREKSGGKRRKPTEEEPVKKRKIQPTAAVDANDAAVDAILALRHHSVHDRVAETPAHPVQDLAPPPVDEDLAPPPEEDDMPLPPPTTEDLPPPPLQASASYQLPAQSENINSVTQHLSRPVPMYRPYCYDGAFSTLYGSHVYGQQGAGYSVHCHSCCSIVADMAQRLQILTSQVEELQERISIPRSSSPSLDMSSLSSISSQQQSSVPEVSGKLAAFPNGVTEDHLIRVIEGASSLTQAVRESMKLTFTREELVTSSVLGQKSSKSSTNKPALDRSRRVKIEELLMKKYGPMKISELRNKMRDRLKMFRLRYSSQEENVEHV